MTFPKIAVKVTNLELTPGLSSLIDQKLIPLGKLIPEGATDASCRVEVKKLTEHTSGKIFRVEVNLFLHGKLYRSEAIEEQVEKAIDTARDELKQEMQHAQGKHKSLIKRGSQALKDMLKFGG